MTKSKLTKAEQIMELNYVCTQCYKGNCSAIEQHLAAELARERKETISEIRNWTTGKKITKDKLREYLNKLKYNDKK